MGLVIFWRFLERNCSCQLKFSFPALPHRLDSGNLNFFSSKKEGKSRFFSRGKKGETLAHVCFFQSGWAGLEICQGLQFPKCLRWYLPLPAF